MCERLLEAMQRGQWQSPGDYRDRIAFGKKCLMNVASSAKFSSDRTIREYASEIWHIEPLPPIKSGKLF